MNRLNCSLLVISLAAATRADAQTPPIARDTSRLVPIVITATKSDVAPVTSAVVVLQGTALRARGVTTIGDALREVGSIHLAASGARGATTSLFLRGGQSNYVKVLVDGVAINEAGGFIDVANLTTDLIERIEVVRGPVSVLHGSDAVSGVVQIFTRRPAVGSSIDSYVRAGSTARKRGPLDAATALAGRATLVDAGIEATGGSERMGWTLGGAHHTHEGILAFNNDWRTTIAGGALNVAPDERSRLRLSGRLVDSRFEYPTNGSGRAVDSNSFRDERRVIVGLEGSRRISERVRVHLTAGTHMLDGISSNEPDAPGDSSGFYSRTDNENFRRTIESRIELLLAPAATLTVGGEGMWQGETSKGSSRFASFPNDPTSFDERRRNIGTFAQLGGTKGAFGYTAGARLDDNDRFGSYGTWRVGVSHFLTSRTRWRGSAGSAFKEPSFIEVFDTPFTRGSLGLRPERSLSWEAGVDHQLAWLSLGATYFDQRFRDMIQYRDQPMGSSEPHYFNIGRAKARGLELEARTDESRALFGSLSTTWLRTRVDDAGFQIDSLDTFVRGERLLRRPDLRASATLGWRASTRVTLSAAAHYIGERDDRVFNEDFSRDAVTLPAYTKVDLSADWGLLPERNNPLTLTLRVENALNASYEEIASYATPGRVVFVGLRARVSR